MYIQGLLRNEKGSLIPNDCHCDEANCTGYDPNIFGFDLKILCYCYYSIISSHAMDAMDANRNIAMGLISIHIIDRY